METNQSAFLSVKNSQIIDQTGREIILRGVGLGGWMNMENFITGFPANEEAFRRQVSGSLGRSKYEFLSECYLQNFFTEEDADFIKSLGLNVVRLPVNYRHFEDDMRPFEIQESGFKHLDRAIDLCSRKGIHTIIDLHAVPGYQNQDWHSDNPSHLSFFWQHKHFQDRVVHLWEVFADRYRNNPWIAGYNPINEPADPSGKVIGEFYRRIYDAIHAIDPYHIIFLEGNRYGKDFNELGDPLPNVVYTLHDYPPPGMIDGGPYPGISRGEYVDRETLRQSFQKICHFMLENNLPIWVGEFGPVYTGRKEKDAQRYQLLRDQLDIFTDFRASWTLWTYKDLGLQGVVQLENDSAWLKKIRPVLAKKDFLGVDSWGGLDNHIRDIMEPLERIFQELYPHYDPFPFGVQWQINRIVRHILLAEPLQEELGRLLGDLSEDEIDHLMQSFLFRNCTLRDELCQILAETQPSTKEPGGV